MNRKNLDDDQSKVTNEQLFRDAKETLVDIQLTYSRDSITWKGVKIESGELLCRFEDGESVEYELVNKDDLGTATRAYLQRPIDWGVKNDKGAAEEFVEVKTDEFDAANSLNVGGNDE